MSEIKELREEMVSMFGQMNQRFDVLDKKIDAVDKKFDDKFDALDRKIDEKTDALDKKIDAVDKKFDGKISELTQSMVDEYHNILMVIEPGNDKICKRLDRVEERLGNVESLCQIRWITPELADRLDMAEYEIGKHTKLLNEHTEQIKKLKTCIG